MKGKNAFAYDLSFIFTRSEGITFAERGYNSRHINLPQVNLVLMCSVEDELPAAIRVIPGSVRDITSLYVTVKEMPFSNILLILDRGFFSEEIIDFLNNSSVSYIIPVRRNSSLYSKSPAISGHFFYNKRLIKYGKKKSDNYFIYLFEDVILRAEEEITAL